MKERTYICCDLKSFYASVECVERGLDPMTTNLVVADKSRTEKTISMMTFFTCPIRPLQNIHGCPSGTVLLFLGQNRTKKI